MITITYRILTVVSIIGLLGACAPPPTVPTSGNLTLEMRRLHSSMNNQEQTVQKLSRQVAELETRLQRQTEEIDQLRQGSQTTQAGYLPARTPQRQGASAASIQGDGSPTEVYLQAFGDYASGRYQAQFTVSKLFCSVFPITATPAMHNFGWVTVTSTSSSILLRSRNLSVSSMTTQAHPKAQTLY